MTRMIGSICVVLAAGALAIGYGLHGWWLWTTGIGLLGVLWVLGYWRGWGWMASVGLVGFVAVDAVGLLLDLGIGWMVFGLVAALCAWDLHRFVLCLERVDRVEDERTMTQRHLGRLLAVAGLGLVLAFVAMRIQVRLTFLMALLLGLLAVWGLSRAVGFMRRESD
jgi:hypothetical protein